jgi:hypothetical protein
MLALIISMLISFDGAMNTIDKAFGPVDPDVYELDYFEKCDLLTDKTITLEAACLKITKEYQ